MAYVLRQPARLVALALMFFPAGGQRAARRNAANSIEDDEGRARSRAQSGAAIEAAAQGSAWQR